MAKVDDVVAAVLDRTGVVSAVKLQKLLYYCQAWHLVWEETPLYRAHIEAWVNGPVIPAVYRKHRGMYTVSRWPSGDAGGLEEFENSSVESVVDFYGDKTPQYLVELSHTELPWRKAREGLAPGDRGNREISLADMAEYYSSL